MRERQEAVARNMGGFMSPLLAFAALGASAAGMRAPRYDEVFDRGTRWLDELAGHSEARRWARKAKKLASGRKKCRNPHRGRP